MQGRFYRIAPFLNRAAQSMGLALPRVLARAGLAPDALAHEGRGLDAASWFVALEALVAEAGDPDRAMALGVAMAAGPLHPALIAFSASPDIRSGLRRLALFKPLIAPIAMTVHEGGDRLSVSLAPADGSESLPPAAAIMEIAYFLELLRLYAARPLTPLAVTLPPGLRPTAAFRAFIAAPLETSPGIRLSLRAEDAATPILTADTEVCRAIERELTARLKLPPAGATLADRVGREIREALASGQVSVDMVARRLGMSGRSLQRRLQSERASFQAILGDTRAALALVYLRDHQLSAEETSYLLAFHDPNSFYRAFSDWTGMTPAQARAAGAAGLA